MKKIKVIVTNHNEQKYWEEREYEASKMTDWMHIVNVYPEVTYQKMRGFGGAFTEAAAHNYAGMSEEKKKELITAYFGEEGLCYNQGRVHMNSCDFALGNYTYIDEGDAELKTFSIEHDYKEIIPMIKDAQEECKEKMGFLVSPWSPPAFMKTNNEMNFGGSLKKEYYEAWANYFVRFIKAYKEAGVPISFLTVQNEPMAIQTWDSCVYTAKEEALFVREYLGPLMEREGLSDVDIFVWDHNKDDAYRRFKETIEDEETSKYVKGVAVHWYTGDHFEALDMIKQQFPDKEMVFTEGCVEYSRFSDTNEIDKAEMYAHDILGNLNSGITAFLDWNLLLDDKGGPNHVKNFCAAPIMCNLAEDTYEKRMSYYYIGHFSRYIKPGAVRIGISRYTDKIEATAFQNPDGEKVIVILNKTEKDVPITLCEDGYGIELLVNFRSIYTICY